MDGDITLVIISEATIRIPLSECDPTKIPRSPEQLAGVKKGIGEAVAECLKEELEAEHVLITDIKYFENFDNPPKEGA